MTIDVHPTGPVDAGFVRRRGRPRQRLEPAIPSHLPDHVEIHDEELELARARR